MKNLNKINNKIYITSDEEIKVGDWYINTFVSEREQNPQTHTEKRHLINHQKDYRFKYCKKIILTTDQDLIKDGVQSIDDEFLEWFVKNPSCEKVKIDSYKTIYHNWIYKIIIPQEEPKQKCECTDECLGYLTKECKRIEEPKRETLEEFAEREYPGVDRQVDRMLFTNGAKWQQEQLCNSEIIQRIRATKSDAEARRIIKSI